MFEKVISKEIPKKSNNIILLYVVILITNFTLYIQLSFKQYFLLLNY